MALHLSPEAKVNALLLALLLAALLVSGLAAADPCWPICGPSDSCWPNCTPP